MIKEKLIQIFNGKNPIRPKTQLSVWIKQQTPFLESTALPKQRLWHIINETETVPLCPICNSEVKWNVAATFQNQDYRKYCSHKCSLQDPGRLTKKVQTELERYGRGKEKIVEKIKKTNMFRYGVDFAIMNEDIKNKQKQTLLERYGVDNAIRISGAIQAREQTTRDMFGVESFSQQHLNEETLQLLSNKEWLYDQHITQKKTITQIAQEQNINNDVVGRRLVKFEIPVTYYPNSFLEHQLGLFLKQFDQNLIINDRKTIAPLQLDFVLPSLNTAIEFNGIYWHGELSGRNRSYHLNKTRMCKQQNIQLIHILESEWIYKKGIVKSIIANKLQSSKDKIYARKCSLVEVDSKTARVFLLANHIQGPRSSSIRLGLEYNGQLVSLLTLSASRFSKKHQYEIYRFCNKLNTTVVGGASKLFKHFIDTRNPSSVITYSDNRFGEGKLYEKLGFRYTHSSAPNYSYFKRGSVELHSRVKFQKHKLEKLLDIFDPELSEWQNMQQNGYDRIWDCGNRVWEWR